MRIINPFLMHEWDVRIYSIVTLSIISSYLFSTISSFFFDIYIFSIIRAVCAFITYLGLPGFIILRIIKYESNCQPKTVIYAVGLSVAYAMGMGAFINWSLKSFGIDNPINQTLVPLALTFSLILLFIASWFRNHDRHSSPFLDFEINSQLLLLTLLPMISILGTWLMNYYSINWLLIVLILIISFVIFISARRKILNDYLPIVIFSISLALLFHRSMISQNLWGVDIYAEFYVAKNVLQIQFWDSSIYSNLNAMLSVSLLPGIYSILIGESLTWVFKILYPIIYSLVPLGIFILLKDRIGSNYSFLSSVFFMAIGEFYGVLPAMARQEIGELFAILILLTFLTEKTRQVQHTFLALIFGIGLIVSHYALSYIFIFIFVSYLCIRYFYSIIVKTINNDLLHEKNNNSISHNHKPIESSTIILFILVALSWYIYTSGSSVFDSIVSIYERIWNTFYTEFLDPTNTEGLSMAISQTTSLTYFILKITYFIQYLLITIGIIYTLKSYVNKVRKNKIRLVEKKTLTSPLDGNYVAMAIPCFAIMLAIVLLPNFAGNIGAIRLFHITLLLLAPFILIGFYAFTTHIGRILHIKKNSNEMNTAIVCIFILITFIFNVGLVHEIVNDPNPSSISLSNNNSYRDATSLYSDKELASANFLSNANDGKLVMSDHFGYALLRGYFWPETKINQLKESTDTLPNNSIVMFREINNEGILYVIPIEKRTVERPLIEIYVKNATYYQSLIDKNIIYFNGGSRAWT